MGSRMGLVNFTLRITITQRAHLFKADAKVKEESLKLMEVIMKGKLRIIKLMGMGSITVMMDIDMKANGRTICPMGQAKRIIKMAADMLDSF